MTSPEPPPAPPQAGEAEGEDEVEVEDADDAGRTAGWEHGDLAAASPASTTFASLLDRYTELAKGSATP
jgi:hypothetical protein